MKAKKWGLAGLALGAVLWSSLALTPLPPLLEGIPFSKVILDREGDLLRLGLASDEAYRIRIALDEVPAEAVETLLLYEDRHFYRHPGINPLSLVRALSGMAAGGRRMGASTLTMQVARLRYHLATTTLSGKLLQMLYAVRMEYQFSKAEILEAYFNLAPYGGNIEGIAAAARVYFHRPVGRLTKSEILALTGIPQNPVRRSPLGGPDFNASRQRLTRLCDPETAPAKLPPLRIFSPAELPFKARHVVSTLLAQQDQSERVRTSIDMPLQRILERQLKLFADRGRRFGTDNAAALLVHAPTMEIRAQVGSADFNDKQIHGQVDGTLARRSPGSTLKPFIYALALSQGLIHPRTLLLDSRRSFGGYDPENFDRTFRGPLPADEALRTSRNIPAIALASRISNPDLYDFLRHAGVRFSHDRQHYGLSLVLGGAEVTMHELAGLYGMLLNQGWNTPPHVVRQTAFFPQRLLSPEVAFVTLSMLEQENAGLRTKNGAILPVRFKTGTSNGFHDAWCAGVFGPYILITWVGDFANMSGTRFVGGLHAVPLWMSAAGAVAASEILDDLLKKHRAGLRIIELPVCRETGDTDVSLCKETVQTLFIPGVSPVRSSGIYRRILIDKATGLRACVPDAETTEEQICEFWPTEYRRLFAMAGIEKSSPPPFLPQCGGAKQEATGRPPVILQPKAGMVYYRRLSIKGRQEIPLEAGTEADTRIVYWFAGKEYLGKSTPGCPLLWDMRPGENTLTAVDELGRSTRQRLVVRTAP